MAHSLSLRISILFWYAHLLAYLRRSERVRLEFDGGKKQAAWFACA